MRKRKKTNKNIRTVSTLILAIIAILGVYMFLKGKGYVKGATSTAGEAFVVNITEEQLIDDYKNIYNVEYGQKLMTQDIASAFETTALAQIRGEKVTFTNYGNNTKSEGKNCIENNIMAAIVNGIGVENIGYKYTKSEEKYYSGAQLAIWEFWNTWVENSDAEQYGFEKGIGNGTITENQLNGELERKKAQEYATENSYSVNIYFLKYLAKNNESNIDNQPNYIYIEMIDEDGEIIEQEKPIVKDSDMYILVSNNVDNVVRVGEEIAYNVSVYNTNEEEKQDLLLIDKLPKGVTLTKVIEIVDNQEIELSKNQDYTYNEEKRKITINIDKIDGAISGTMTDEENDKIIEYTKNGSRRYKIIVKANELKKDTYSKEITNIAELEKANDIYAREKTTNIISDAYLEIETDKLPEIINEQEEYVIGLKITNKGLVAAQNVNIKVSIPEEISMQKYKISTIKENEVEGIAEGTTTNIFEKNYAEILAQTTIYIQLKGKVNNIEETKSINIEGIVNNEKITWLTRARNMEGG